MAKSSFYVGSFCLREMNQYRHDPRQVVVIHCKSNGSTWPYTHEINLEEEAYKRAISFQDVQAKIGTKRKITFRATRPKEASFDQET